MNEDSNPDLPSSSDCRAGEAPSTPDAENSAKTILNNGQLQVLFDDKTGILTIQTPGANKMILSDQDQSISISDIHGNSIRMSASGIEIKSAKDITLMASGGTLSAKGAQGVTVSGLKIALSADTELSVTGQASASLNSSGTTIVKGTMVMIN